MAARSDREQSIIRTRIAPAKAFLIGVVLGCLLACLCFHRLNAPRPRFSKSQIQIGSSSRESSPEGIRKGKDDEVSLMNETIANLKKQVKQLNNQLRLAEQTRDIAQEQVLLLCKQQKVGPVGTVKALSTNPTVVPDESVNLTLANLLNKVAINKELIVALVNSKFITMLQLWVTSIKQVGISNYLVVAVDDHILDFCKSNDVPVYRRDLKGKDLDLIARRGDRKGDKFIVSGFKFQVVREFLQLGYSVLLSDVDIVYLQNPFDFLYRDSDVEATTDGHDNKTAYGYNEFLEDQTMGQSTRFVYTSRIWAYNSGFFYIRPTIPSIELLDRVAGRLSRDPNLWDQAVFHEELVTHSRPGYDGLYASKRFMDFHLFMNSKVLFRFVRRDAELRKLKPVIVHVNYHSDKLERMKAIVEFYVEGKQDALDPFRDGSWW